MLKASTAALLGVMVAGSALAAGAQRQSGMDSGMDSGIQQQQQSQLGPQQQAFAEDLVRDVQENLQRQGYDVNVDGIFGPNTRQALMSWQQRQGMPASGQINLDTLAGLGVVEGAPQQAQTPEQRPDVDQQRQFDMQQEQEQEQEQERQQPQQQQPFGQPGQPEGGAQ